MTIRDQCSGSKAPCGTRVRYGLGCRCTDCRKANSQYEMERARIRKTEGSDVWVDVAPVREHLLALSAKGIGYKTVSQYADVGHTCLAKVMNGKSRKMRRTRAERILAVTPDCVMAGTLVSSRSVRQKLKALKAEGFTMTELARRLGYKSPAIQFGKRKKVTAKTRTRLERFWNILNMEAEDE